MQSRQVEMVAGIARCPVLHLVDCHGQILEGLLGSETSSTFCLHSRKMPHICSEGLSGRGGEVHKHIPCAQAG